MFISRRRFLKLTAGSVGGLLTSGGVVLAGARDLQVSAVEVPVLNLPHAFTGLRIALLADFHHGPWMPQAFLEEAVARTNALGPDLVALCGDFIQRYWDAERRPSLPYIEPCFATLGKLRAPLGTFAVLGNHDNWDHQPQIRAAVAAHGISELRNAGCWLERGGDRLRIGGTEDLWTGRPDLGAALGDTRPGEAAIILQHNPDWVETLRDPRVGLVLSGHTHGGQVVLPWVGAPVVPSRFGRKYVHGFVPGSGPDAPPVFVTRGIGTTGPPVRFACPPEIALLTLHRLGAG